MTHRLKERFRPHIWSLDVARTPAPADEGVRPYTKHVRTRALLRLDLVPLDLSQFLP